MVSPVRCSNIEISVSLNRSWIFIARMLWYSHHNMISLSWFIVTHPWRYDWPINGDSECYKLQKFIIFFLEMHVLMTVEDWVKLSLLKVWYLQPSFPSSVATLQMMLFISMNMGFAEVKRRDSLRPWAESSFHGCQNMMRPFVAPGTAHHQCISATLRYDWTETHKDERWVTSSSWPNGKTSAFSLSRQQHSRQHVEGVFGQSL